jgi:hypothetical protein
LFTLLENKRVEIIRYSSPIFRDLCFIRVLGDDELVVGSLEEMLEDEDRVFNSWPVTGLIITLEEEEADDDDDIDFPRGRIDLPVLPPLRLLLDNRVDDLVAAIRARGDGDSLPFLLTG